MNNDLKYCYYGNKKKTIIKAIAIYEVSSFFSLESFKLKESKPFFFFFKNNKKKALLIKYKVSFRPKTWLFLALCRWKEKTFYPILYRNE